MANFYAQPFQEPTKKQTLFGAGIAPQQTLGGVVGGSQINSQFTVPSAFNAGQLYVAPQMGLTPLTGGTSAPIVNKPIVQPTVTKPQVNTQTTQSNKTGQFGQYTYNVDAQGLPYGNALNTVSETPNVSSTPVVPGSLASILPQDTGYNYVGQDGNLYNSITGVIQEQQGSTTLPTEAENYANTLKQYQADIDAINNMYNDTLNQSRVRNAPEYAAREAQNRLQQIQGGIATSPIGSAQTANVQAANREAQAIEEQMINIQRQNAINSIKGEIRQISTKDLEAKRAAKSKSADDYVKYLNEAPERKAKNISAAVKKALALGLSLEEIDPKDIEALGGLEDFTAEYNAQKASIEAEKSKADLATRKTEADIAKTTAETGQIGKVSPSVAAQIAFDREKLTTEGLKKNYDEKTIPSTVKSELITDLNSNLNAKKKDRKTLNDFIAAYPEVDSTYLVKLFEATK